MNVIPFYKRFSNRLAFWIVGLLFVAQGISLFLVNRTSQSNAEENVQRSIIVAQNLFRQAYENENRSMQNHIEVLSADYGLRQAFSSEDTATITSAMNNHMNRLERADWMMLISLDEEILAHTLGTDIKEPPPSFISLLEEADEAEPPRAIGVGKIQGKYTQIFVAPLMIPDPAAWIVIGFFYTDDFVEEIKKASYADISLLDTKTKNIIASTLPQGVRSDITQAPLEGEKILNGEQFIGRSMPLSKDFPQFQVVVQQSMDAQLKSSRQLSNNLFRLFFLSLIGFGVVVFRISRGITQPVSELTKATQEVEKGNLDHNIPKGGDDELGRLLQSFGHMMQDLSEKERIRNLLGKVVSPEIANELLHHSIELGGEEKYVTMLFSDIRGFTKACEGEDPKRILDLLNIYLTEVATIIEEHHGVVDKFIGDAVMALFGAPITREEDPQNAVQAALDMSTMLVSLNQRLQKDGYDSISIGIGVHSGSVVAGNMGSENRLNYTVIGDNVNLCSRLEGLTKFYGVSIIVSEETRSQCPNIHFRFLDRVQVKGKSEAVSIFQPLSVALSEEERTLYAQALIKYTEGDFRAAKEDFERLCAQYPAPLYGTYQQRCQDWIVAPPTDWQGIYKFQTK